MHLLVINLGSSSIKISLYQKLSEVCTFYVKLGKKNHLLTASNGKQKTFKNDPHFFALLFKTIEKMTAFTSINLISHRIVHGGPKLRKSCAITPKILNELKKAKSLAPLHNPKEIQCIEISQKIWPRAKQIAHFDTEFFNHMPLINKTYPLSKKIRKHNIIRYGFHGLSHEYCFNKLKSEIKNTPKNLKTIICHLGSGCSISAVKGSKCINTSMGFSPLDGLMMSTRCGSMDPKIVLYLLKNKKITLEELEVELEHFSGLLGISNTSSNIHKLLLTKKKSSDINLAIDMFIESIAKHISIMVCSLSGCDHLIFTGGIGENLSQVRKKVIAKLSYLNLKLDLKKNQILHKTFISDKLSSASIWVFPTDENLLMAKKSFQFLT